jgi:alkanesulfonate monooxygenase SsuD/methylene tetrahydromethanopterin reductase-like flavin-dependent oxidoreductase (luciferase family)
MTDAAAAALGDLIAGEPTALPDVDGEPIVHLAPGTTPPPLLVGGMSEAAMRRTVALGADWFVMPVPPDAIAAARTRMAEVAAAQGRPVPPITAGMVAAIDGDPALGTDVDIAARLTNPDGVFAMPAEAVDTMLVRGKPRVVAERLAALGAAGVDRVVLSSAAGDWHRQVELLAEARSFLD